MSSHTSEDAVSRLLHSEPCNMKQEAQMLPLKPDGPRWCGLCLDSVWISECKSRGPVQAAELKPKSPGHSRRTARTEELGSRAAASEEKAHMPLHSLSCPRGSALGHYPWMVMLTPAQLNDEPAGSLSVHPGGGLGRKQGERHHLKGDSKEEPGTPAPPGPGPLVKPAWAEQTCGCCRQEGVAHPSQESFQA